MPSQPNQKFLMFVDFSLQDEKPKETEVVAVLLLSLLFIISVKPPATSPNNHKHGLNRGLGKLFSLTLLKTFLFTNACYCSI